MLESQLISSTVEPKTRRGRRSRDQLLHAAEKVFERDGYLKSRITDITRLAGVGQGTFYRYFDSKEDVFRAVIGVLVEGIESSLTTGLPADSQDVVARIDRANRQFLDFYRSNASLMAVFEQVATFDEQVREMRQHVRRLSAQRIEREIRRLQADGHADPGLEPRCAANALASMVNNFAYTQFVIGESFDDECAATTLTRLWVQALGQRMPTPFPPSGTRAS